MELKISAAKAKQGFENVLNRVASGGDEYVIERGGRAVAALVPVERLKQVRKAARLRLLEILKRNQEANRFAAPTETERLVNEAVAHARASRRDS
ncbi:MAG: type II toxin-antitoxin system prevent-host-death family antitoxin [Nitrospirae bacterium]|nr:type II toxin-antitoxin system prevent-host-death family antitoxin [Nitrospirota bacterium]